MRSVSTFFFLLFSTVILGQTDTDWKKSAFLFTPEILLGKTMEANEGFPPTGLQKQLILNFGRNHARNPQQWAQRLKGTKTGFSLGITEFGNYEPLGIAFTALPYIEFRAFGSNRFSVHTAMGASYFTRKFDPETNPENNAVTTHLSWAYRLYLNYQFHSGEQVDWRLGVGYSHHSNGHTRLLNIGYNSFLISLSAEIKNPLKAPEVANTAMQKYDRTTYEYIALRGGLGQNVLSVAINDPQAVYTFAGEYGRVFNNTFKLGVGFYSRIYRHYYNYIKDNGSLVQPGRDYDYFSEKPLYYASNFGISLHGEFFLNHIGIDLQLGFNFHKPAYKMDYRMNEGWENTPREIPEDWLLGTLDTKYKLKYRISSRLGLKYYLIGMEKAPKNNFYIGAHLNANLGQADFSELSLGYVYSFNQ